MCPLRYLLLIFEAILRWYWCLCDDLTSTVKKFLDMIGVIDELALESETDSISSGFEDDVSDIDESTQTECSCCSHVEEEIQQIRERENRMFEILEEKNKREDIMSRIIYDYYTYYKDKYEKLVEAQWSEDAELGKWLIMNDLYPDGKALLLKGYKFKDVMENMTAEDLRTVLPYGSVIELRVWNAIEYYREDNKIVPSYRLTEQKKDKI